MTGDLLPGMAHGSTLALQFEPMYLQKGTELETTIENVGSVRANGRFSYIEVPAMFKLVLGNGTTPARPNQ